MKGLLLEGNFFSNLWDRLVILFSEHNFWIATGLAILGGALLLLARRLTRVHRGVDIIANDDKVYFTYKILSFACIIFAVIIWIFYC